MTGRGMTGREVEDDRESWNDRKGESGITKGKARINFLIICLLH
jgi:hypothetical protein